MDTWLSVVSRDLEKMMADDVETTLILELNPAAKLLDFYREVMVEHGTTLDILCPRTLEKCSSLKSMSGVGREWIQKWVSEWYRIVATKKQQRTDQVS